MRVLKTIMAQRSSKAVHEHVLIRIIYSSHDCLSSNQWCVEIETSQFNSLVHGLILY